MTRHREPTIETRAIDEMFIDGQFQRRLRPHFVVRIVRNFDPALLDPLDVNERRHGLSVLDGQHRLAALRQMGVTEAVCRVHRVSAKEEADLFVHKNRDRLRPKKLEEHKPLVFTGDPQAVEIDEVCAMAGLRISDSSAPGTIACVGTLYKAHSRYGARHLRDALQLLVRAWPEDRTAVTGEIVHGMTIFLAAYENEGVDVAGLERKLSLIPPAHVARAIRSTNTGTRSLIVAREILAIYNHKRRSRYLPDLLSNRFRND